MEHALYGTMPIRRTGLSPGTAFPKAVQGLEDFLDRSGIVTMPEDELAGYFGISTPIPKPPEGNKERTPPGPNLASKPEHLPGFGG